MAGLAALGVILLLADVFAVGVLFLVVAVALLPTFLAGARRWPESPVARVGVSTADRVRDEADVAVESITTWSRAGRDVVRLRREQYALRRQRETKIRELGVSVYADDGRADELKTAAKELDERLEANERELQRTIAGARRRVRKGRAAVVATEVIRPDPDTTGSDPDPEPEPDAATKVEPVRPDPDTTGSDPEPEPDAATKVEPVAEASEPLEEDAAARTDGERRGADPPDDETKIAELDDRS